jgi:hypothetical protein
MDMRYFTRKLINTFNSLLYNYGYVKVVLYEKKILLVSIYNLFKLIFYFHY